MAKKRYDGGGLTDEEKEAGLLQSAKDAGVRLGPRPKNTFVETEKYVPPPAKKSSPGEFRRGAPQVPVSMKDVADSAPSSYDLTKSVSQVNPGSAEDQSVGQKAASDFLNRRQAVTPDAEQVPYRPFEREPMKAKKGGVIKKMAKGGSTSSASKRADGIAQRGHTKGKYC